jgi:flagellar biosynthesis/type III secretory pathway M-ring protein FliF/YscJ
MRIDDEIQSKIDLFVKKKEQEVIQMVSRVLDRERVVDSRVNVSISPVVRTRIQIEIGQMSVSVYGFWEGPSGEVDSLAKELSTALGFDKNRGDSLSLVVLPKNPSDGLKTKSSAE